MDTTLNDKQVLYDGRKLRLEIHHLATSDGRYVQREVVVHRGAVVILPFLDAKTILLIRNRRYTIGQWLVELPAGTLERGEDPMNAAGRELEEETGYLAGHLKPLMNFFTSPGILTERMYCFVASQLQPTRAQPEEDEQIEVVPTPFDQAVMMIRDGRIQDAKTIATLLGYDKFGHSA